MSRSSHCLVIGISSHALFDLRTDDQLASSEGLEAFRRHQLEHEDEPLAPGPGLPLVEALLKNNKGPSQQIEIVVTSKKEADASVRILSSIRSQGFEIPRAVFTGGQPLAPYLRAFRVDLLLSTEEKDVREAWLAGVAGGLVWERPEAEATPLDQIRVVLDADAVRLPDGSTESATDVADGDDDENASEAPSPLQDSFAKLIRTLSLLQSAEGSSTPLVRTALLTSRGSADQERIIRALRRHDLRLDEAFSLGGLPKDEVLEAFAPHIVFEGRPGPARERAKPNAKKKGDGAEPDETEGDSSEDSSLHSPFSRLRFRSSG